MPLLKAIGRRFPVFLFLYSTNLNAQNDVRMLFKEPAGNYHAASPLGNGRLGAMVFWGTGRERIVLNEISMWSGGVQDADDPNAINYLPQIRQLLLEGRNAEAQHIPSRLLIVFILHTLSKGYYERVFEPSYLKIYNFWIYDRHPLHG